jgi:hypothetical protein
LQHAEAAGLSDLADFSVMHEVFGHETVTEAWLANLMILDVETGEPLGRDVRLLRSQRREAGDTVHAFIDVAVGNGAGRAVWLQVGDSSRGIRGVAVPRDLDGPIPLRLDVALQQAGPVWQVATLSARLAPPEELDYDVREVWAPLWEAQRDELFGGLGGAVRNVELLGHERSVFRRALREKMESPVAAAVGAIVLLRGGALSLLEDWPRNLANWFPWLAEGPILWAETVLRRARGGDPGGEALTYFRELGRRGPPLLNPVVQMAAQQALRFRTLGKDDDLLTRALAAMDDAGTYLVPEGLFATFVSDFPGFGLEQALKPWKDIRAQEKARSEARDEVVEAAEAQETQEGMAAPKQPETRSREQ